MQVLTQPEKQQTRVSFYIRRPTYAEAKSLISGHVRTQKQYVEFRTNNPDYNLPAAPGQYYKNTGWVSSCEFYGVPEKPSSLHMKQVWQEIRSGERKRNCPKKYKTKQKSTEAVQQPVLPTSPVVAVIPVTTPTTSLDDKRTFIALAKKLGVYDQVKPAFKTLFTYDELLDLVNL